MGNQTCEAGVIPHQVIDIVTGVRPRELIFSSRDAAQRWLDSYQVSDAYKEQHYRIVPMMACKLTPIKTINRLTIYKRDRRRERHLPLYTVYSPDARCLEDFRSFAAAEKWAKRTLDFVKG